MKPTDAYRLTEIVTPARRPIPRMAPFETFRDHLARAESGTPYNEAFLAKCRDAAVRYDKEDVFLRSILLDDLWRSVPVHSRGKIFDGISFEPRKVPA